MLRYIALACLLSACDASCVERAHAERRGKAFGQRPGGAVNVTVGGVDLSNEFAINLTGGASDDRIELADDAALECGTQCTFFLRLRTDVENANSIYLSKWDQVGLSRSMVIDCGALVDTHCNVRVFLCTDAACSASWSATTRAGAPGTIATSIVVTLDFTTSTARVYLDGANYPLINTVGTFPAGWVDSAAAWTWGARQDGNGTRELDGVLDDFGIDPDYAWSPAEVWQWHNRRGSARLPAGITTAFWCRGGDDDGGAGTSCTDYGGSGRTADLLGTAVAYQAAVHTKIIDEPADTLDRTRQVIVALGQSNMAGRGVVGDIADQDVTFPNRGDVWIYDNNGPIGTPNGTTNPAAEPVDDDTGQSTVFPVSDDSATGVGPMLAMANRLAELWPNKEIGVIPCALGGTEAGEWTWTRGVNNFLWGECETRWAESAIGTGTAEIAAAVIYQGEQNAQTAFEASTWRYQWASACEGIRDSIGERDVPCVFVRLPATPPEPAGSYTEWANLRAEQATICDLLDHCAVVDAPDGPWTDTVHLATSAQLVLGHDLADAIVATDYGQAVTP
jgi:hypothetical protein